MRFIPYLIAALLATGAGYGYIYTRKQREYLETMRPRFAGVRIVESTPDGIIAQVMLAIPNKSDMDITVKSQRYEVLLNGSIIQTVERTEPLKIAANGETTATFNVLIKPKQAVQNIFQSLLEQARVLPGLENITLSVRGELTVEGAFVLVDKFKFTLSRSLGEVLTNYGIGVPDTGISQFTQFTGFGGFTYPDPSGYTNPASGFRIPPLPLSFPNNYPIVNRPSVLSETGAIAQLTPTT